MTHSDSDTSDVEAIAEELARLREEVETLRSANDRLRESEERFHQLAEASPHGVAISVQGDVIDINRRLEEMIGLPPGHGIGIRVVDYVAPSSRETVIAHIRSGDETPYECVLQRADGSTFPALITGKLITYRGQAARVTVIEDLTERKRAESLMLDAVQREALLQAQEDTLAMLSVPLLPILDGVVLMPLVGNLSPERNQRVMEALCTGVVDHTARVAILDITGLSDVGPQGAEGIARAARAVALLGASVVLTGVGPTVAAAMVRLDIDLEHIATLPTLARGVSHALQHRQRLRSK